MGVVKQATTPRDTIAPGRTRYLAHTDHLLAVVIDFEDGPAAEPDAPHSHPHEQVTYVASGSLIFFVDGEPFHLETGDLIAVPPDVPHCIQTLSDHVRLVDTFNPIREDFLQGD
jgi:quercetin dioxygenase-like cupin family protein